MSYFIHRFNSRSEEEAQAVAVGHHAVTIGSGRSSDLQLLMTVGMADVCLKVWSEGEMLIVENSIREPGLIFLNGGELTGTALLQHGDVLQMGHDQFAVVFDPHAPATEPEVSADLPISRVLETSRLNATLARHTPVDSAWTETSFLEQLCNSNGAFLFANFRHAGFPEPESAGDDLYQGAPDEVRESYSLHAMTQVSTEEKLRLYEELRELDAAIWVIPETDHETSLKDAKIHFAWFARPSVMDMTLMNSPDGFCESLLKPFKAIILKTGSDSQNWAIYTKATFDPVELGICDQPE